jgi:hypothetical protein
MKIQQRTDLLIINVFAVIAYFLIFSGLNIGVSGEIMFSTNDAISYLNVSQLNSGLTQIDSLEVRPFLYPLIIALFHNTAGPYGLWIFQLILWLGALNFLFAAVKKISGNNLFAYCIVPVYISNLSLIALTLHALTEVTTIFLLSLLIWFISHNILRRKELGFIHRVILILSLLTVVKPVFYPVLCLVILIVLPFFYSKQYRLFSKKLITLILVLSPVLAQLSFMKLRSDVLKISMIGDITLRDYLFAQSLAIDKKMERDSALVDAKKYAPAEVNDYLLSHRNTVAKVFLTNLENNCNGYPIYLDYPANTGNPNYIRYMIKMNDIYFFLHKIFLFLLILAGIGLLITRRINDIVVLISCCSLFYFILLTSGISAYQYDRLTITAFPLWIFIYLITIYYLVNIPLSFIKKRTPIHS